MKPNGERQGTYRRFRTRERRSRRRRLKNRNSQSDAETDNEFFELTPAISATDNPNLGE
jgi:hypothetical protein